MASSRTLLILTAALSALALAAAFTAEFGFHIAPCILCLAQRVPFVLAIVVFGAAWIEPRLQKTVFLLLIILFLVNAGIGAFQVGEEQKWWGLNAAGDSQVCTAPNQTVQNIEELYQSMSGTALGDCAHPAFSWHGVTFAAMNIVLCLFLAAVAGYGVSHGRKTQA